jgi:HEPN domain-containing protein
MKDKRDLVRGWFLKARSDLRTIRAAIEVESFDVACFHAQQTAEKALKAYLIQRGIEFPFTHNLSKLIKLCLQSNPSFSHLEAIVEPMTPFAVELRYDAEFWPERADAEDAERRAQSVIDHVQNELGDIVS